MTRLGRRSFAMARRSNACRLQVVDHRVARAGHLGWQGPGAGTGVLNTCRARDAGAGDDRTLSDQQLVELSQAETIEIYDERPDKPFDRDTSVRLTGDSSRHVAPSISALHWRYCPM